MRLTRVTGTGAFASGWNATGVFQAGSDNLSSGFDQAWMTNDPTGGALVAMIWTVELQGPGSYVTGSYRRTPLDGAGGFSKGFGSPPNANVGGPLGIAPDGAGGAYLAWAVSAVPTRRMQHYSAGGTELWPNPTAAPVSDAAIADGSGGLYLFGRPPGFDRLEVHRRASDASIPAPWTSSGVEVSASGSYSAFSMIRSDVLLYAVWSHGPAGAHDLRASAVTANAALAPGWAAGGDVACDATGHQVLTDLIAMPPSEALAAWEDRRSDNGPPPQQTGSDIFVTRLPGTVVLDAPRWGPPGPATLAFSAPPSPNPARDRVAFTFTAAEGSAPTLEIVDVAGRVHGRLDAEARTGRQSLAFDTGSLAPGLYWARLRQGAGTAVLRFAVVR
jgi:hypothetical protein